MLTEPVEDFRKDWPGGGFPDPVRFNNDGALPGGTPQIEI